MLLTKVFFDYASPNFRVRIVVNNNLQIEFTTTLAGDLNDIELAELKVIMKLCTCSIISLYQIFDAIRYQRWIVQSQSDAVTGLMAPATWQLGL